MIVSVRFITAAQGSAAALGNGSSCVYVPFQIFREWWL